MSEVTRRELMPGVWLRSIHTGKFKSAYLSVTLLTPLEAETASENALIPAVLRQGTADHPDLESLSAALDELYGGAIEPVVRKKGETSAWVLWPASWTTPMTLDGSAVLEPSAAPAGGAGAPSLHPGRGLLPRLHPPRAGEPGHPYPRPGQRQAPVCPGAGGGGDVRRRALRGGQGWG
mgnify:CR=1 FL=1